MNDVEMVKITHIFLGNNVNSRVCFFSKKSRISSFFVHSDVNLVTLVLFASLNDPLAVFNYIFKSI